MEIKRGGNVPILIVPSAAPCKQRNIPNNTSELAQGTAAMDNAEIITASDMMRSVIVSEHIRSIFNYCSFWTDKLQQLEHSYLFA